MGEIIARRQFDPLYIWLDIIFLLIFMGLLLALAVWVNRGIVDVNELWFYQFYMDMAVAFQG